CIAGSVVPQGTSKHIQAQTRHFYLARTRHFYKATTTKSVDNLSYVKLHKRKLLKAVAPDFLPLDDVHACVKNVAPAFTSTQRSFTLYVRCWVVADRIRVANCAGTFDDTIKRARVHKAALAKRFGIRGTPSGRPDA
ncbi:hypothetical protein, partial [Paraburkholderia sp.]|uniref:hypothetical protein n=1 Tax=Paraburkholderia sp. TaxID=1926495 RepID=UPI003C7DC4E4